MTKRPHTWSLADAKAHLSSVVDQAESDGPQVITRRGTPAAVVVSAEQWKRVTAPGTSLSEFLAASPLKDLPLELERGEDDARPLDL